ncbi:MAG: ABC transporter permease [Armatimonadetes bacterium]|nr:ABC transporter permease [Armatimonadota bacterium]
MINATDKQLAWRRAGVLGRRLSSRLLWGAVTLLCTTGIVFSLLNLAGDPAQAMAGEKADKKTVEQVRVQMGFDRPLPVQLAKYVARVARGDLGESSFYRRPVAELLLQRLPFTIALALGGLLVWVGIGVPVGVFTALRRDTWIDRLVLVLAVLTYSVPTFWLGRMLQHALAYRHAWFPVGSFGGPANLVLPSVCLGLSGVGYYARLVHTNMVDVLPSEYVRTARAKGLTEWVVLWRHAFRCAMLPVVTVLGLDAARLLGGVVFTETIFAWPGLGSQMVQAIPNLDIPLVLGTVLFAAALVVVSNIVVDLLYFWLDPRLRDEGLV